MYFLQMSDTHSLTSYEKTKDFFHDCFLNLHGIEEKLVALQQQLLSQHITLDFICHCGDLCHAGEREDYEQLQDLYHRLFPKIPLIVTAGNHDKRDVLQEVFCGGVFSPFVEEHQVGALRILSFDNTNGAPNCGEVTEETCVCLLEKLRERPEQATILCSHHHILEEQSAMPPAVLSPRFQEVLQEKNIIAYLTGHTHEGFQGKLGHIPYYTVPSHSFQAEPLGGGLLSVKEASFYHLFSYEKENLTLVKVGDTGFSQFLGKAQRPST